MKIGFIGLGVMGAHMARHLVAAGHDVTVYNRTAAKAEAWVNDNGGRSAATPAALAEGQDIVMACVGNDADLLDVTTGAQGAFGAMASGTVFVDHTTASADVARRLQAEAAERGIGFVDAPVSGGEAGARDGVLTVMCGGTDAAFDKARPLIDHYARAVTLLGPVGSGQKTKMVNQIAIAGLVQGLSEALHFAEKANLDVTKVVDVISKGAAQSWQMEIRSGTMIAGEFNHGFAVDWMRKDLAICLEEARSNGAKLPVTALVDQFYGDVQDMGGGRWDTSSLLQRLRKK